MTADRPPRTFAQVAAAQLIEKPSPTTRRAIASATPAPQGAPMTFRAVEGPRLAKRAREISEHLAERPADELMDARSVAKLLEVGQPVVEAWRLNGLGPAFVHSRAARIRYRIADLREWLASIADSEPE